MYSRMGRPTLLMLNKINSIQLNSNSKFHCGNDNVSRITFVADWSIAMKGGGVSLE